MSINGTKSHESCVESINGTNIIRNIYQYMAQLSQEMYIHVHKWHKFHKKHVLINCTNIARNSNMCRIELINGTNITTNPVND